MTIGLIESQSKEINYIKKFFILVLFVLVIFTPQFKYFAKYTWLLSMFGVVCLFNVKFRKTICVDSKYNTYFLLLLFCSILVLALQPLIHFTYDFTYEPLLIGIILTLLRNYFLLYVICINYNRNRLNVYLQYLVSAGIVYVIFTVLFIIFPQFKDFWLNSVLAESKEQTFIKYQYRYSLSGFAAFMSSSIFSVLAIISAYMIALSKKSVLKSVIRFTIICIGCFFYGRVAFAGIGLGLVIIFFGMKNKKLFLKICVIFVMIVSMLMVVMNYLETVDQSFALWKDWAFSFITQIFVDKKVTDYSVVHMIEDMYFMPDINTLLFGDGRYTEMSTGRYYMHTDVGYMRLMLYGGIFVEIVAFIPLLYMLFTVVKQSKYRSNITQKMFFYAFFAIWLILEAKGESYHRMIMIFYPIFILFLAEKNMVKTKNY